MARFDIEREADFAASELAGATARAFGSLFSAIRCSPQQFAGAVGTADASRAEVLHSRLEHFAARGDRLVRELLEFAGQQELVPVDVEALPMMCSLADKLRRTLDHRTIISVEVSTACPPCHADPVALEDALIKLAINARDAMGTGGHLVLAARTGLLESGAPAVAFSVSHSEGSMSDDVLRRACEPFFSTKLDDPRAGLGLAAVAGFVRRSGGELKLQSDGLAGVSVAMILPQQ